MHNLLKWKRNEQGYTLAGVLLIFMIVSILGMSIIALSVSAMKVSTKEHDNQSAFYIAESGTTYRLAQLEALIANTAEEVEDIIEANPEVWYRPGTNELDEERISIRFFEILDEQINPDPTNPEIKVFDDFDIIKGHQPKAEIMVQREIIDEENENPRRYHIESIGTIGNEQRIVNLPIDIEWLAKPTYALLTRNDIVIKNTGSESGYDPSVQGVQGNIGTLEGIIDFTMTSTTKIFKGDVLVPDQDPDLVKWINPTNNENLVYDSYVIGPGHQNPFTEEQIKPLQNTPDIPNLPEFIDVSEYTFTPQDDLTISGVEEIDLNDITEIGHDGVSYDNITIVNDGDQLIFDVGSDEYFMSVDNLNVSGDFKVKGTGSLIIYVDEQLNVQNSNIGEAENPHQIYIYYAGGNDITMGSYGEMHASVYAFSSNINLAAGGTIYGNILTGGNSVKLEGGAQSHGQLILAPDAHVQQYNGDFRGTVVADRYTMEGTGTVKFEHIEVRGPFTLEEVLDDPVNADNTIMQRLSPVPETGKLTEK